MPNYGKVVRVFISSTFRDMQAERDHLIKVVFPALREELETMSRQIANFACARRGRAVGRIGNPAYRACATHVSN